MYGERNIECIEGDRPPIPHAAGPETQRPTHLLLLPLAVARDHLNAVHHRHQEVDERDVVKFRLRCVGDCKIPLGDSVRSRGWLEPLGATLVGAEPFKMCNQFKLYRY